MTIEFKSTLLDHQKEHLKFHLHHPHSANWSEMGTGKTVTALKYVTTLFHVGLIDRVLVICPLSVFHTWEIEIEKHTTLSVITLIGDLNDKLEKLRTDANIYLISYDSIPGRRTRGSDTHGTMIKALLNKNFDLVIADEVTKVKGYGTLRTRAVTIFCDKTPFTLFLSGTPITNNPSSIFNIYRAMDGGKTFGKNFFAARNKFFYNAGFAFPKWELKPEMKEELQKRMYSSAVRVRKDDCLDLPPKIFSLRFCYLTDEQRRYYIPIAQDLVKTLDTEGGSIRIQNAMTKITKLSQLTSGFMYTDDKTLLLDKNPKADLTEQIIEDNPGEKIIIYCYWREDVRILTERLRSKGYSVGALHGGTPSLERSEIINKFQNGDLQFLVANIGVGGYGLTLTSSSTIIYYNLSFKVDDFLQSQDRIHRHGQAKTCLYLPVMARGTIDEYIYATIVKNTAISESIVDGVALKDSIRRFINESS